MKKAILSMLTYVVVALIVAVMFLGIWVACDAVAQSNHRELDYEKIIEREEQGK